MTTHAAITNLTIFQRKTCLVVNRDLQDIVAVIAASPKSAVLFCNVHMLMHSEEDVVLSEAMNKSEFVFADGVPIAWLQRKLSGEPAEVIRGYEVLFAVCKRAEEMGEKVGFFGSSSEVIVGLIKNLKEKFNGLQIVYHESPPYMDGELATTKEDLDKINESDVQWLFVGLGCPKQEKWIATYRHDLNCHILGVGAAFDWLSGNVSKPPAWMENHALGWLYRLAQNPARMGHRYLKYNSKFILKALPMLLKRK